ncbi:hypothetical protein [Natrinema versiforme]|uniref:Uncharacterized protein n=1 Tax=Natrinema versiforme TaxID=88724 RepID=A0A4P8WNS1_9EURY|nr:hypothetical protein [Natrinema versiforme]QCS44093.1 hypothetical protein FEJ81_17745 [Natrinema versiforme]
MASRREILGGTGVLTASVVAGCLDELENDSEDGNTNPSEQETSYTERLQDQTTDGPKKHEEISSLYESGDRSYTSGFVAYMDAVRWYNAEEFSRAQVELVTTTSDLESAEDDFSEALDIAMDIDHAAAISILEEAKETSSAYRQAAELLNEAAELAGEGSFAAADSKSDKSNAALEDVEMGIEDQEVIDSALDLD